jgi:hypothetical protein
MDVNDRQHMSSTIDTLLTTQFQNVVYYVSGRTAVSKLAHCGLRIASLGCFPALVRSPSRSR